MIFFLLFLETLHRTTVIGPCEDPCGTVFERIRATRKNQDMQISTYFSKFKHNLDPGESYKWTAAPESTEINRRGLFKPFFTAFPSTKTIKINGKTFTYNGKTITFYRKNVQKVTNITNILIIFTKFITKIFTKCLKDNQKLLLINFLTLTALLYYIITNTIQFHNNITMIFSNNISNIIEKVINITSIFNENKRKTKPNSNKRTASPESIKEGAIY